MSPLAERRDTYFTTVRGMCRSCRTLVPARVAFREGRVYQQSLCPTCRTSEALIAGDVAWYLDNVLRRFRDRSPLPGAQPPRHGCPLDCGPCTWHSSPCQLPVFSITNDCDLACPVCFTFNRPERPWYMPVEELQQTLDAVLRRTGPLDLVNLTGGEPTRHPELRGIIRACRRPEIGRVTLNSNGLALARDPSLAAMLAEQGVHVILSFSTREPATSVRIHGRDIVESKLRAIDNLSAAGVTFTLLFVLVRGVNHHELGMALDLLRSSDRMLSLTVQTMTYTGQGGGEWTERAPIPVDEAAGMVAAQSRGALEPSDFLPRPAAHPLCYLTTYLLKTGDTLLPFTRFAERQRLLALMADSYLIRLEGTREFFTEAINDLYARRDVDTLPVLRSLVERLFPRDRLLTAFERQRLAESAVRTVTLHAHMDEDTFDCARAMLCTDQVPVAPGRLVPACTYNLFTRRQDERFFRSS